MQIISKSVRDTLRIGKAFARNIKPGDIICLSGDLGAGKTILVKGIAEGLGMSKDKIVSPTFVLIREHDSGRMPLYHFDLYRLKSPKEITRLGYEEYFYGQGVSAIEWGKRLDYLMPKDFVEIDIYARSLTERVIIFSATGARSKELLTTTYEDIRH